MRMIRATLLCCATAMAVPVAAQEQASPKPFRDFTFKRVKPPSAGATQRITVQIAPGATGAPADTSTLQPEQASVSDTAASGVRATQTAYPWFWEALSPDLAAGGAGRLFDALDAVQANGRVAAPRLQTLQSVANAYGRDLLLSTVGTEVSPAFALAVISVESAGRADAVSRAGAQGLMQLMPATAARFGVKDAMDPAQNIAGGVAVLDHLIKKFESDPLLVLAAYNAGEGSVRDHGGVPPFAETRNYIPKVLAAYQIARGLCVTPPILLSDGCVFAGGS